MSHSSTARGIQKRNGTTAAAMYLKRLGWPMYMTLWVLTGKWVMP